MTNTEQAKQNLIKVRIALKNHAEGLGQDHHFYDELEKNLIQLDEVIAYLYKEEN